MYVVHIYIDFQLMVFCVYMYIIYIYECYIYVYSVYICMHVCTYNINSKNYYLVNIFIFTKENYLYY